MKTPKLASPPGSRSTTTARRKIPTAGSAGGTLLAVALACVSAGTAAAQNAPAPAPSADVLAGWCGATPKSDITQPQIEASASGEIKFAEKTADGSKEIFVDPKAFPAKGATTAAVLSVVTQQSRARDSLLSARVQVDGLDCFATEAAAPSLRLLLPGGFHGNLVVTRHEDTTQAATVGIDYVSLKDWFVDSLSQGHALRATIAADKYQALVDYARCEYLNPAERTSGCATETKSQKRALDVYEWLSQVLGRSTAQEFARTKGALSEPIVAFFGIANTNVSALLDCRDVGGPESSRICQRFSEPWQTSLQRAKYAWAVYLEDELTGFDTAIDVEFKSRAPALDYEEFDPRAAVQTTTIGNLLPAAGRTAAAPRAAAPPSSGLERRTIRIGYRRFRIRQAPVSLQVAFTRQGTSYGARQYQRVYRKESARPWAIAGTVFVAAKILKVEDARILRPEPLEGTGQPQFGRVNTTLGKALVYTGASLRWPALRDRASDQTSFMGRFALTIVPDLTAGFSFRNGHDPYFVGGGWPVWPRLHATVGMGIVKTDIPGPGYVESQLVPLSKTDFTQTVWKKKFMFGVAIDLIDSR